MPLSPAPSSNNGEIVLHGLQHIIKHNASSPYPENYQEEAVHLRSNYGSPAPVHDEVYSGYHGQQPRYAYQHQEPAMRPPYDGCNHDYQDSVYPTYSTPATSPPTPQMHTRSGYAIPRPHQALKPLPEGRSRIKEFPKLKKERKVKAKAEKKIAKLEKPLSELTKDWKHVEVVDIEAYVNRSAETRRKEVEEGKIPGKVKRPMNSFMLYRKAYQNRTKDWCLQNNHQVVSQVCGDSWPLEPDEVKEQFNEWARIERQNHQNAHPGYKFSPTKPGGNKTGGKRGRNSEDPETEESDLEDWDWQQGGPSRRSKRHRPSPRLQQPVAYPTTRSAYHYSSRDASLEPHFAGYQSSSYQATNPGRPMPQPYSQVDSQSGEYYQQTIQNNPSIPGVQDVILRKVAAPGGHSFLGLPGGGQEYDLMSQYPSQYEPSSGSEYKIDPSLISQEHSVYSGADYGDNHPDGVYFGAGHNGEQHWQPSYDLGDRPLGDRPHSTSGPGHVDPNHDSAPIQDHHAHVLRGNTEGWHVESLDEGGQFEKWMDE